MDAFIGTILAFGFQFSPAGWSYCNGEIMSIGQHQALYSLLGIKYGGDGRTTFGLPDFRGRTAVGQGQGPELTNRVLGAKFGEEMQTLTEAQLPAHTHEHTYNTSGSGGSGGSAIVFSVAPVAGEKQTPDPGDYIAAPSSGFGSIDMSLYISPADYTGPLTAIGGVQTSGGSTFNNTAFTIGQTGQGFPFYILQPSLTINYCINMNGTYPSRN